LLLWALLIGMLVYIQWPMLKGVYYKMTGAAAPAADIAWRADFQSALAEAGESGKPVLIDFSASWCPPCQVMKHEVWPDREVAKAIKAGYVPLLVDVDGPNSAEIAQRYGVSSIPSIVVVDAQGRVLRQGSFMTSSQMLNFLKKA
jgi:protein disulfide-isomerase